MKASSLGPLDLPFRGGRDYLHSAALFDAIVDAVAPQASGLRDIDYIFEKRTDRQVLLYLDAGTSDGRPPVATLRHRHGIITVVETDAAMIRRVPYDEDAIAHGFEWQDASCLVRREQEVSFISALVAAFKAILTRTEPENKFAFVRLKLDRVPEGGFSVERTRVIGGRFYEGRITAGDQPLGFIYFGVWS